MMFAISTGEDWNVVMYDCGKRPPDCIDNVNCGSRFSIIYFFTVIIGCTHIMLNLFILVIIQQFEKYYLPKDNQITLFKDDLNDFLVVWKNLTQERHKCRMIKDKDLILFFRELGKRKDSLGFSKELMIDEEMKKAILKMSIKSDNGFIYFNELLYRCMRRKYGNHKINKKM